MPQSPDLSITAWRLERGWQVEDLCEQATLAEAWGFSGFWLPENHFGDERAIPAPLMLLSAVAARTQRLRLGTTSYLLPFRNPILAAEEVAVLDQLSGGRVILGVGRGMQKPLFNVFGVESKRKRALFEAHLATMMDAWRGESLGDDGKGGPVHLAPPPVQLPHPPVWIAAFGELALAQAGRLGMPYLASPIESLDQLADNYARHRDAMAEAGKPVQNTVPVMRTVLISDDRLLVRRVRESLEGAMRTRLPFEPASVEDWALVGDREWVFDKLAQYTERLSITHLIGGGRLPRLPEAVQRASHEELARFADWYGRREMAATTG